MKDSLIGGFIHSAAWLLAVIVVVYLASHSPAKYVYAYLSGWWFALYIGCVVSVRLNSILPAIGIYILLGLLAVVFEWRWFYHDVPSGVSMAYMLTVLLGGVVFASPIIINASVRFLRSRWLNTA